MATLIAIHWLVIVIGLLFKCSLDVYCAIFNIYQQGRDKHLILNMDVLNSDIASNVTHRWKLELLLMMFMLPLLQLRTCVLPLLV